MFNIFKKNRKKSTCYACGSINKKVKLSTYGDDFTRSLLELFEILKSERKVDQKHKRFKISSTGEFGGTFETYQVFLVEDTLVGHSYLFKYLYSYKQPLRLCTISPDILEHHLNQIDEGLLGDTPDRSALRKGVNILGVVNKSNRKLEKLDYIPSASMYELGKALFNYLERLDKVKRFKNNLEVLKEQKQQLIEFRKKHGLQ